MIKEKINTKNAKPVPLKQQEYKKQFPTAKPTAPKKQPSYQKSNPDAKPVPLKQINSENNKQTKPGTYKCGGKSRKCVNGTIMRSGGAFDDVKINWK